MTGLPKSIIKKYGVTKKAWQVFRGSRSTARSSASKGRTSMARRKGSRRAFSRSRSAGTTPTKILVSAAAYGATRALIQQRLVAPLAAKLPMGGLSNYADNVILLGAGYLMRKKGSGMVRDAGTAVMIVEAAMLGAKLGNGLSMTASASSSSGGVAATF